MLKRHYGSSLRDWLGAAEYILAEGNKKVILCPIHEYWIDIGRPETLNKAHQSWEKCKRF